MLRADAPFEIGDLGFDPWIVGMWIGLATFTWSLVGIYYNIIVGVGSANSQDYTSRFVIVPGPRPGTVKLAPKPAVVRQWPAWLKPIVEFLPNIVRRDFIVWLAATAEPAAPACSPARRPCPTRPSQRNRVLG